MFEQDAPRPGRGPVELRAKIRGATPYGRRQKTKPSPTGHRLAVVQSAHVQRKKKGVKPIKLPMKRDQGDGLGNSEGSKRKDEPPRGGVRIAPGVREIMQKYQTSRREDRTGQALTE